MYLLSTLLLSSAFNASVNQPWRVNDDTVYVILDTGDGLLPQRSNVGQDVEIGCGDMEMRLATTCPRSTFLRGTWSEPTCASGASSFHTPCGEKKHTVGPELKGGSGALTREPSEAVRPVDHHHGRFVELNHVRIHLPQRVRHRQWWAASMTLPFFKKNATNNPLNHEVRSSSPPNKA